MAGCTSEKWPKVFFAHYFFYFNVIYGIHMSAVRKVPFLADVFHFAEKVPQKGALCRDFFKRGGCKFFQKNFVRAAATKPLYEIILKKTFF